MAPTLNVDDRVLVIKKPFIKDINYGDVIIFYPNGKTKSNFGLFINSLNLKKIINLESNDIVYIKRVIGKQKDIVKIMNDGSVLVNDEKLNLTKEFSGYNFEEGNWVVPLGQYFVLGDNLLNSNDSRVYGFIKDIDIVGKAWLKIFPFNEVQLLND